MLLATKRNDDGEDHSATLERSGCSFESSVIFVGLLCYITCIMTNSDKMKRLKEVSFPALFYFIFVFY